MSYIDWKISKQSENEVSLLASELGCSDIVSRLLINRGFNDAKSAKEFLLSDNKVVHDPYLLIDMDKAINRIVEALNNSEKICIYGDYDVDGITSVSVLYLYLMHFTNNLEYYIPDRFSQGYGVNENAIQKISDNGSTLIITVDTGISAFDEIKFASKNNIDVIVTDHHECQNTLPDAIAVINSKRTDSGYPFSKLAGVGVVYKLISAIDLAMNTDYANNYLDLVAIGTVSDIMPLVDENRYIVKKGIEQMQTKPNLGLKSLMDMCLTSPALTSATVGFAIAPRINAAGRMSDAEIAVKLFLTDDRFESNSIAEHLCKLNSKRQQIENSIYNDAVEIIEKHDLDKKYNALVLWSDKWHSGVIGIVASRLKDKYNKPVVLFSVGDNAKGSGRSVAPFNLYKAFSDCKDILLQFGGHKYAAGVLIENDKLYEFRNRLSDCVCDIEQQPIIGRSLNVECELKHDLVVLDTAIDVDRLQPFGKSNDVPLFCIRNLKITDVFPTTNNKHLRIKFLVNDKSVTGFYFGVSPIEFDYRDGDIVDIVCELAVNEYRNNTNLQFIVRDMRYTKETIDFYADRRVFCNSDDSILSEMLPSRFDIASVYRFVIHLFSKGKKIFNLDTIANLIKKDSLISISYEKVHYSIEILLELKILHGYLDDNSFVMTDVSTGEKISLTDSSRLSYIYEKAGVKFGD